MSPRRVKHLVVDTSAFIRGAALQDIAETAVTVQEVIDEVTSHRQLRKLIVLPYELLVKDVFSENIKFITEFAKKTGDYTSLSATDIKVMALTYQLEKEMVGVSHLKLEPTAHKTIRVSGLGNQDVKDKQSSDIIEGEKTDKPDDCQPSQEDEIPQSELLDQLGSLHLQSDNSGSSNIIQNELGNTPHPGIQNSSNDDEYLIPTNDDDFESGSDEEETGSDDGEWITSSNIQEKKKEMDRGDYFEDKTAEVACITTDFAMQNVLKQIGLNVTSIDGRIIRHVRTFIFRCTTCFKTTSIMTKLFCPKCGHATLKKVAVSVDEHGNQNIHINGRKLLSARGKKFSLPTPKGGQHFQYPVLTEDQHIHKRNATRLARIKNNPLDPDYTAGFSPFTMRDVNSKSAVLGVRHKQDMKQWLRKTANDVRKKRK